MSQDITKTKYVFRHPQIHGASDCNSAVAQDNAVQCLLSSQEPKACMCLAWALSLVGLQVRAGIALAVALERTFVLPKLTCFCDRSW